MSPFGGKFSGVALAYSKASKHKRYSIPRILSKLVNRKALRSRKKLSGPISVTVSTSTVRNLVSNNCTSQLSQLSPQSPWGMPRFPAKQFPARIMKLTQLKKVYTSMTAWIITPKPLPSACSPMPRNEKQDERSQQIAVSTSERPLSPATRTNRSVPSTMLACLKHQGRDRIPAPTMLLLRPTTVLATVALDSQLSSLFRSKAPLCVSTGSLNGTLWLPAFTFASSMLALSHNRLFSPARDPERAQREACVMGRHAGGCIRGGGKS
mmetsp:Transcript_10367/g.18291  ORF Transcript_10367/g.18291 Transcript_10367/m.18291 type:complete len:266 (+) Transcript_10367:868-1665(+)